MIPKFLTLSRQKGSNVYILLTFPSSSKGCRYMGSETLDIVGFLVQVPISSDSDKKVIDNIRRHHPEVFEKPESPIHSSFFVIKNTGPGLLILDKLYKRFHPFCLVHALIPFNRWMLPEKVKEVGEKRCPITKKVKRELEGVKYSPKIIAISKNE